MRFKEPRFPSFVFGEEAESRFFIEQAIAGKRGGLVVQIKALGPPA